MILLHLVGVCHRHRTLLSPQRSGILGVNPWPVQLESLFLSSFPQLKTRRRREYDDHDNEDDAIEHHSEDQTDDDFFQEEEEEEQHLEPIWLQNRDDLTCLGPTGSFTECGDATLWFIQRHTLPQPPAIPGKAKRQFLSGIWQKDSDTQMQVSRSPSPLTGWTFQVVDRDYGELAADHPEEDQRKRNSNPSGLECLDRVDSAVQVLPCKRKWMRPTPSSGVWLIDDQGSMQVYDRRRQLQHQNSNTEPLCLHRGRANETDSVVLGSCADPFEGSENNETLPVRFSFVRYRAVTITHDASAHSSGGHQQQQGRHASLSRSSKATRGNMPTSSPVRENAIPSSRDKAHIQAEDDWMHHTELMRSSQLLFHSMNKMNQKRDEEEASPLNTLLQDTNPILLMGHNSNKKKKTKPTNPALLHPTPDEGINIGAAASMKMRPIQKHPYIEQAKNEVWTDPQTALEYFTDLSTYLGRDRAVSGRHTLTGVGQYRKGYVIKVYGIAYYVSKRDVLADPTFATYARMSEDELRARPDFYTHLRQMNYRNEDDNAGKFERTLMLKTNMQLSAETMRSSLQADWRMLSDEMKDTLIGSSMEPRPADEDMLKLIQSPENPSRCSCSQVAPEEYQADPDCCARGTELVFTWLKNGDLEVCLLLRYCNGNFRPDPYSLSHTRFFLLGPTQWPAHGYLSSSGYRRRYLFRVPSTRRPNLHGVARPCCGRLPVSVGPVGASKRGQLGTPPCQGREGKPNLPCRWRIHKWNILAGSRNDGHDASEHGRSCRSCGKCRSIHARSSSFDAGCGAEVC